jgi:hypothetical protein
VRRAHPPSHISLDGLAVTTHWSCPQAPGCTNERGDNFPETGGSDAAKELNRLKSSIRARVENVFGCMSMPMGAKLTRKIGVERSEAWWALKNLTFNFIRDL